MVSVVMIVMTAITLFYIQQGKFTDLHEKSQSSAGLSEALEAEKTEKKRFLYQLIEAEALASNQLRELMKLGFFR